MEVTIINQHTQNYGDDAAGLALINELLLYNEVNINIIYNTKGVLPIENIVIRHCTDVTLKNIGLLNLIMYISAKLIKLNYDGNKFLREMKKIIKSSDYIFVSPCGANIGIYKDWRFVIKLLIVIMEGKKPIFYLNTIGRSGSSIFDFVANIILKKSILYVREKKSFNYLQEKGLHSKLGVDTAFLSKKQEFVKRSNVITFVPTLLDTWHPNFVKTNIRDQLIKYIFLPLCNFAKEKKFTIEMVPHLNSLEELEYYTQIKNYFIDLDFPKENIFIRTDVQNVMQYEECIASSEFVIGMRYHTIVLAAKNYVPFISLAYENKMNEVSTYTNMEKYNVNLIPNSLKTVKFSELICDLYNYRFENTRILKETIVDHIAPLARLPLNEIRNKDKKDA